MVPCKSYWLKNQIPLGAKVKLILFLAILATFVFSPMSFAQSQVQDKYSNSALSQISGSALLTSHFIDKGLSMSNGTPALNASFLYTLGSEVKVGFWGSNISNITAADDSFWLKIMMEIGFGSPQGFGGKFELSDNHFYKSNQRNGQKIKLDMNYYSYLFGLEWMSNVEGTRSNGEYLYFGKLYGYGPSVRFGGVLGYTMGHIDGFINYFDAKVTAEYIINSNNILEAGVTAITNNSDYGRRGDPAIYASFKLNY